MSDNHATTEDRMKRVKQGIKTFCEMPLPLRILIVLLFVLFVIFLFVMFGDGAGWIDLLGRKDKGGVLEFIGIAMGGVLLAIQATVSYRRAKAMEDTVEQTEQGQRQERLKNAIEHLEHERSFMHLGGAYELFHLAEDTEALRQTVLEILCAHIRRTTRSKDYQKEYGKKPSEEIQSLLNLLFTQDHKVFRGCHINLQGSRLNGASLREARLQEANLRDAHLQEADLWEAQLQGAKLSGAQLQEAMLFEAQLPGADLRDAHLPGAGLSGAHLPGADLRDAYLPGADLSDAHLPGANLRCAHLPGADLSEAQLPGAKLWNAHLPGANLRDAHLPGADLSGAHLPGAELWNAHLQGADLRCAHLQGAELFGAHLPGADLRDAHLQGADLSNAHLQEAMLLGAQLQGAELSDAHLQGANLLGAHLQGAIFKETQLQGAVLFGAHLQGVFSSDDNESQPYLSLDFAERIRQRINKESDFSTVVFSGGLSEEEVNNLTGGMPNSQSADDLKEKLKPHIGQPASHKLPADSGADIGSYTEEEADRWIKEYKES
ncbi:MAG: Secreted effector protein PipB2 [Verrucomicrobia subdivision 3 bacterium]|nr:Secreted effector protein PipB2 [Limisphaerales bacterium]